MFDLDFRSEVLRFPHHPRYASEAQKLQKEFEVRGLKDHFLLFSSGTTSRALKGYALSRKALLANAHAVNEHLGLNEKDVWGLSLPYYHVGGLSVLARAHLSGSRVVDLGKWSANEWVRKLTEEMVTVTTVVPTQVYDLVFKKLTPPKDLRYLVVGGDFLSRELEERALALGWPLFRTFGMTEVASQLACARSPGGVLEVLPLHEVKVEAGRLLLRSESLFTLQFICSGGLRVTAASELCDDQGFYRTNDLVELEGRCLRPLGRSDDQVKVSGKLVPMNMLREELHAWSLKRGTYGKIELGLQDDERLGKQLILLHLPGVELPPENFFSPLKPQVREVDSFERTDLGKLKLR